ncbi:Uncharacterised protein [Mycobacteroides abscessus subsp. abscessus]|nr:Uncharacterised protein [Mycobacteroides abscessus subsp. abscessus]SHU22906.1 Uncharacterised protein [Mycobacteroides abscessus subsp. abscessus]SHV26917.1 Uncharacterised protein [Mycobacteroides abscessus subsp. abscessus]SHZ88820.1 Uncharacterised protein [Mycobacteroides abscessus subsp. abscessus]SIH77522.1 Uncharacterised protein [Mycobacteroides abscessus subsp. abscessus]
MVSVFPLLFPVPVFPIAALVRRQLPICPIRVLRPQCIDIGLRRVSQFAKVALVETCAVLERHAGMVSDEVIAVVEVLLFLFGEPVPPARELLRLSELLSLVENPGHRARIRIAIGAIKQTNRARQLRIRRLPCGQHLFGGRNDVLHIGGIVILVQCGDGTAALVDSKSMIGRVCIHGSQELLRSVESVCGTVHSLGRSPVVIGMDGHELAKAIEIAERGSGRDTGPPALNRQLPNTRLGLVHRCGLLLQRLGRITNRLHF